MQLYMELEPLNLAVFPSLRPPKRLVRIPNVQDQQYVSIFDIIRNLTHTPTTLALRFPNKLMYNRATKVTDTHVPGCLEVVPSDNVTGIPVEGDLVALTSFTDVNRTDCGGDRWQYQQWRFNKLCDNVTDNATQVSSKYTLQWFNTTSNEFTLCMGFDRSVAGTNQTRLMQCDFSGSHESDHMTFAFQEFPSSFNTNYFTPYDWLLNVLSCA